MSFSTSSSSSTLFSSNAFLNPGPAPPPPQTQSHHLAHQKMLSASIDGSTPQPKGPTDSSKFTHSSSGSDSSYNDTSANGSPTSTVASSITHSSPREDQKGRFIKHGWVVSKEDGAFKMWNRKYLVLRDSALEFYKNEVCPFSLPSLSSS